MKKSDNEVKIKYWSRYFWKFIFSGLCIAIPLLASSIVTSVIASNKMRELEKEEVSTQLNETVLEFIGIYENYKDESLLLTQRVELSSYNVLTSETGAYKGVEILRLKRHLDDLISDVIFDYGTNKLYTSEGTLRKRTFFSATFDGGEESIVKGFEIFDRKQNEINLLFRSENAGYVICSYLPYQMGSDTAVHYLIPFVEFIDCFHLQGQKQWYKITAKDGCQLSFGVDNNGKKKVLSIDEMEERINSGSYNKQERFIEDLSVTIELYYKKEVFSLDNALSQMQLSNILLVIVAVILSFTISWLQSSRRISDILRLEKIAQEGKKWKDSGNNAFSRLEDLMVTSMENMRNSMLNNKVELKKSKILMIFNGAIKKQEDMEAAFRELSFDGCPERFFVGCICTEEKLTEEMIHEVMKDCLSIQLKYDRYNILQFLYPLDIKERNHIKRRQVASDIKEFLQKKGLVKVLIGISRIYMEPLMIECACKEALSALEYLLYEAVSDFCICWESIIREKHYMLLDKSSIEKFMEALVDEDLEAALKWFEYMMKANTNQECTMENQEYNRYSILNCLVQYLDEKENDEKEGILKECLSISIRDSNRFEKSIRTILKRCLEKKHQDSFTTMLGYIDENYYRSDLTYEEVANVGGVTKTYISKMFRANLGMSYVEYLANVRMEKAAVLLRTTDMSINDIVKMVGYVDGSGFRRSFRNKFKISPVEYRKEQRKKVKETD